MAQALIGLVKLLSGDAIGDGQVWLVGLVGGAAGGGDGAHLRSNQLRTREAEGVCSESGCEEYKRADAREIVLRAAK